MIAGNVALQNIFIKIEYKTTKSTDQSFFRKNGNQHTQALQTYEKNRMAQRCAPRQT